MKLSIKIMERVVKLRKEIYVGFNDRHFKEKLAEEEGLEIGYEFRSNCFFSTDGVCSVSQIYTKKQ